MKTKEGPLEDILTLEHLFKKTIGNKSKLKKNKEVFVAYYSKKNKEFLY